MDSKAPKPLDKEPSIVPPQGQAHKTLTPPTTGPETLFTEPSRYISVRLPGHSERASVQADLDVPDVQGPRDNTGMVKCVGGLAESAAQRSVLLRNEDQGLRCKSCKETFKDSNEFSIHVTLNNVCFGCNEHHVNPEDLIRHCLATGHAHLCRGCWDIGLRGLFSTAQELQTHAIDSHSCSTCSRHHDSPYELIEHCLVASHNCICKGCDNAKQDIQGTRIRQHFPQNFTCLDCHNHHQDFPSYAEHCDETGHISMCFGCLTRFDSVDLFREHLSSKHACLTCHIHFSNFEYLRSHFIATGHAPSCKSCRAVFEDKDQLNTHFKLLFTCVECHAHHSTNADLMRHRHASGHPVPIKTESSGEFTHEHYGLESGSDSGSEDILQLARYDTFDKPLVKYCNCDDCNHRYIKFSKVWPDLLCKTNHTEYQKRAAVQPLFRFPAHLQVLLPSTTVESAVACSTIENANNYHEGRVLPICRCPDCDAHFRTLASLFRHLQRQAKKHSGDHTGIAKEMILHLGWTIKPVSGQSQFVPDIHCFCRTTSSSHVIIC